jgi:hypothetical protein
MSCVISSSVGSEELVEMGVESIHDIPEDFLLTERQRRHVR